MWHALVRPQEVTRKIKPWWWELQLYMYSYICYICVATIIIIFSSLSCLFLWSPYSSHRRTLPRVLKLYNLHNCQKMFLSLSSREEENICLVTWCFLEKRTVLDLHENITHPLPPSTLVSDAANSNIRRV